MDNMLTIIPPPEPGLKMSTGTRFVLADGTELQHVARCVVVFGVDEVLHAVLELNIDPRQPIEAQPLLGLETVRAAAEHHGFDLVRKARGVGAQALIDAVLKFADDNMPAPERELTALERHAQRRL